MFRLEEYISALTISLTHSQEVERRKNIFVSFFNSLPSNSAHMKTEFSLSRAHSVRKTSCMFKALFFVAARWLCSQSIFFRPYNITVIAVSDFSFYERQKLLWLLACICKCENLKNIKWPSTATCLLYLFFFKKLHIVWEKFLFETFGFSFCTHGCG